jgi:ribokinase
MIAVVGSFNLDLFIEAPRFPKPGEAIHGKNFRRAPGGKGANQAFAVARMGMPAAIIGAVGRDAFGDEMLASLRAVGVDVSRVARRAQTPSGTAMIVLDARGQNQIVVANGANDTLTAADVSRHAGLFQKSRAVLAQLETTTEATDAALRLGRAAGAITILNPAPFSPVSDDLLALCDWIIPNEGEAEKLSRTRITTPEQAAAAARAIRRRAPGAGVALTLGERGVRIETPKIQTLVRAFRVKPVDTVGAGDTFIGAFVTRLVEGADPRDAARFGCAAAAIAVTRHGAQSSIPTRAETEALVTATRRARDSA